MATGTPGWRGASDQSIRTGAEPASARWMMSCSCARVLFPTAAMDQPRRDRRVMGSLALEMAVLLRPQLAIDRAALEQHAMRSDVDDFALLHHQDQVAFGQRRQPVGDD